MFLRQNKPGLNKWRGQRLAGQFLQGGEAGYEGATPRQRYLGMSGAVRRFMERCTPFVLYFDLVRQCQVWALEVPTNISWVGAAGKEQHIRCRRDVI